MYLIAGAFGALVGMTLAADGLFRKILRGVATAGCVMGLLGAVLLSTVQQPWTSHCAFRYCGRTLGLSLVQSPFPVATPSCRDLHMCANEYVPFSESQWRDFYELIKSSGCEPP